MLHLNKQSSLMNRKENFFLTQAERYALESILGYITGNISDTGFNWNYDKYEEIFNSLNAKEQKKLKEIYNLLSDERSWPEVSEKILSNDEILLIKCVLDEYVDKDLVDDDNQYEIADILDKI